MISITYSGKRQPSILIIYTGGTIGMYEDPESGALSNFDFAKLASYVPELYHLKFNISCYPFDPPIDSSDMLPRHWAAIACIIQDNYESFDGFVVLHGTDTMAYTASALSFMLQGLGKPVVFTGSQLPIGTLRTDGKENLLTSLEIAAATDPDGRPTVPEVCVFFENQLLRGNRTTKISAEGFNAFRSFNYPLLGDAGIHLRFYREYIHHPSPGEKLRVQTDMDTHLAVLSIFPGIRREVVKAIFHIEGVRAVVLVTYGSGNAPQKQWLIEELEEARRRDIVVVNVTQCSQGTVEMGRYATGLQLLQAGVVNGYDSTVESAVTKLMYLLAQELNSDELRARLSESISGEATVTA